MGLAKDLYDVLFADWDGTIITKPTSFSLNDGEPRPQMRNFYIQAKEQGDLLEDSSDNTMDGKLQKFKLTFYEGLESDAVKGIRATKKALHSKAVANGYYHIDTFDIQEEDQLVTTVLEGRLVKVIGVDEF